MLLKGSVSRDVRFRRGCRRGCRSRSRRRRRAAGLGKHNAKALLALLPFDHGLIAGLGEVSQHVVARKVAYKGRAEGLDAEIARRELDTVIIEPQRMFAVAQEGIVPLQDIGVIDPLRIRTLAPGIAARCAVGDFDRVAIIEAGGDLAAGAAPTRYNSDATHLGSGAGVFQRTRNGLLRAREAG